jgi:hypothetical protein
MKPIEFGDKYGIAAFSEPPHCNSLHATRKKILSGVSLTAARTSQAENSGLPDSHTSSSSSADSAGPLYVVRVGPYQSADPAKERPAEEDVEDPDGGSVVMLPLLGHVVRDEVQVDGQRDARMTPIRAMIATAICGLSVMPPSGKAR